MHHKTPWHWCLPAITILLGESSTINLTSIWPKGNDYGSLVWLYYSWYVCVLGKDKQMCGEIYVLLREPSDWYNPSSFNITYVCRWFHNSRWSFYQDITNLENSIKLYIIKHIRAAASFHVHGHQSAMAYEHRQQKRQNISSLFHIIGQCIVWYHWLMFCLTLLLVIET